MRIKADITTPAKIAGLPVHTAASFENIVITLQVWSVGMESESRDHESF